MKSNNTYFNILVSYAMLGKSKSLCDYSFNLSKDGISNVMIDSGAFTLFNAKQNHSWITVDNYCNFLDVYGHLCEKYVMLDVIGNDHQSKENYELMIKRGYNPMFVFTMVDNDFKYLKYAADKNEHVCVAGGVTTKGDWMTKRFQDVYLKTQCKIHGLGYVTYPKIYQLPLHSVDSSSWIQLSQVYGKLSYFDDGIKSIGYHEILKNKKRIPFKLIEILEKLKISPKDFSNITNHKGNKSIGCLLSTIAYIEFQKLSKRKNINLFLAVSNTQQLKSLNWINTNYNNKSITYNEFKNQ